MLLKTWFGLVNAIIVVSLFLLLFNFKLTNALHWISLIALILAAALSMIVYIEQPHKKKRKSLEQIYHEYILRKEKELEELRKKNDIMFKTAVKRTEADIELAELRRKLEEKAKE